MEKDNVQTFCKRKEEIQGMVKEIESLYEKIHNSYDYNDTVDLSGEIIERLRLIVVILNMNYDIVSDRTLKTETVLVKDYFINYINGIINNNQYIIKKYRKNINDIYKHWRIRILNL